MGAEKGKRDSENKEKPIDDKGGLGEN